MRFHEFSWKNIKLSMFTLFLVQMWDSSVILQKYQTFKVYSFPSSDVRFKYYSSKMSNFQSSLLSHFRCEIQVLFFKNIKLSKLTLFLVQMWYSSIIHAVSWIFMKKYQTFNVHSFPSSDVRFKCYSSKISNFQSLLFS